jgi:uncharacterized membrane protein YphA (DoxX/SURF4 family)
VQRLFSVFPNAWPGCGLLLLRLAAGVSLLSGTVFDAPQPAPSALLRIAEGIVGALLVVGLWTPAAAMGLILIHLWCAASVASAGGIAVINLFLGLSLAMLGPGAWSVDARLYGRKRIEL